MTTVAEAAARIEERISAACARAGRDRESVKLIAVSKTQPTGKMIEYADYCASRGEKPIFGENYVQEFKKKSAELNFKYSAHLIGGLQSNKAKDAAAIFDVVQSVDSKKIAEALNNGAARAGKILTCLLQVNISFDDQKRGFEPDDARRFLDEEASKLAHIEIAGLMTITKFYAEPEQAKPDFASLAALGAQMFPGPFELSMGMSQDFEAAIAEGATMVRVGTAIFGERTRL